MQEAYKLHVHPLANLVLNLQQNVKISVLVNFFLFFFNKHNSKTIMVHANIIHTKQLFWYQASGLGRRKSYNW